MAINRNSGKFFVVNDGNSTSVYHESAYYKEDGVTLSKKAEGKMKLSTVTVSGFTLETNGEGLDKIITNEVKRRDFIQRAIMNEIRTKLDAKAKLKDKPLAKDMTFTAKQLLNTVDKPKTATKKQQATDAKRQRLMRQLAELGPVPDMEATA